MNQSFYIPQHFTVEEFFPKTVVNKMGLRSWILMDSRLLYTADEMRKYFNKKITVNNWNFGGKLDSRGFRLPDDPDGSPYSQHNCGRAMDFDVEGLKAEEVRGIILKNKDLDCFKYITAMEKNVNWVHIDVRNVDNRIFCFNP